MTMPASSRWSNSLPTISLITRGTVLGLQNLGLVPSFKCRCALNDYIIPKPVWNTSAYFLIRASTLEFFVTYTAFTSVIVCAAANLSPRDVVHLLLPHTRCVTQCNHHTGRTFVLVPTFLLPCKYVASR